MIPYSEVPPVVVDGQVSPGEYSSYSVWANEVSDITVDVEHDNASLYVALTNPSPGWVALGFSMTPDEGMGFIVVGDDNGTLRAVERWMANVSDEGVLEIPVDSGTPAIEQVNITGQGGTLTAEMRLRLNSSLWTMEPGELVPTVLAGNATTLSLPDAVEGSRVSFLRAYPLRPEDDPAKVQELFMASISPVPGIVAVAVMSIGLAAVTVAFLRRKGGA